MKNEIIYEDFNGQLSFVEPNKPQEYVRNSSINPRNIGFSNHPLYHVWQSMKQRCHNRNAVNYRFYGARGISVCDEWHDFQTFLSDMEASYPGKGFHIDRINQYGNYCKANCRWIKASENIRRANMSRFGSRYRAA